MIILFSLIPLLTATYLVYLLTVQGQVKCPLYTGKNGVRAIYASYSLFGIGLLLLAIFSFDAKPLALSLAIALTITGLIGILFFRVTIGENGLFMKLRFHAWSEFKRYRWIKLLDQGVWILYLYRDAKFELTGISIPESKVTRLDLMLQNKSGLEYLDRT